MSVPLSSPVSAVASWEVDLRLLHRDCESSASRAIEWSRWYRRNSISAGIFSAVCCCLTAPLFLWQHRETDRVWRIRNPMKVRNQRLAMYCTGSASILTCLFLISPLGFMASTDVYSKHREEIDAVAWDALHLAQKATEASRRNNVARQDGSDPVSQQIKAELDALVRKVEAIHI